MEQKTENSNFESLKIIWRVVKKFITSLTNLAIEKKMLYLTLLVLISTTWFNIASNKSTKEALNITRNLASTSEEGLRLLKLEIEKGNDPFFNFEFLKDDNTFTIEAPDNVRVKYVEWYFPDATDDFKFSDNKQENRFVQIKETSVKLSTVKILDYLVHQIVSLNKDLTQSQAEYYIKCSHQLRPSNLLSVLVTIGFNERGSSKNERVDKYLYIDNTFSENPNVYELDNIDNPEIERQFFNFGSFEEFLNLSSGLNWKDIKEEEINLVNNNKKKCDENMPEGKIWIENYRSFNN